jgi:hypothetical protein
MMVIYGIADLLVEEIRPARGTSTLLFSVSFA